MYCNSRAFLGLLTIVLLCLLFVILHNFSPSGVKRSDVIVATPISQGGWVERSDRYHHKIQEHCHNLGISTHWDFKLNFVLPRRMIKKPSIRLFYGCNPKTGSSSFKKFLFKIDGVVDPHNVHLQNNGHYEEVQNLSYNEFKDSIRVVFVRNPLTRLISAFRDKQLKFERYLTPGIDYPESAEPFDVFRIFLAKIMFTGRYSEDVHLQPQWLQLQLCAFPYNLVADYEHSKEYIRLIQIKTNTQNITYPVSSEGANATGSSDDITTSWLEILSEDVIRAIESIYELDFYILGYTRWGDEGFPHIKSFKL